ncbi:MAG: PCP reductase family protein [Acidobacteriota bacterium]
MKFLCITCDEPMKLDNAAPPDERGSLTAVYECPTCTHRMAMLTNPMETEMVQSLGIKIGSGSGASAGDAEGASKCPFSGMIGDMPTADEGVGWTTAALERLENIPEFVRPMARQGIEQYAKSNGHRLVDEKILDEARDRFGM